MTAAGLEMLVQSRAILGQFRDAEEAMARLKGIAGGTLSIAVISAGDYFFPRLLAAFAARHPGVTLDLAVHNREGLLRCLDENLSDLAVMVRPPADDDTLAVAFAPHAYVIVASPSHPLAGDSGIPLARVLAQPFVVRERGSDTVNAMREAFADGYAKLHIAMEIASNETIKQAVIAGLGLSFLSAHAIALEHEVGRLAVLDVEGFPSRGSWYVVQKRAKRLPPVAAAFRAFLLEDGARLIAALATTDSRSGPAVNPKTQPHTRPGP